MRCLLHAVRRAGTETGFAAWKCLLPFDKKTVPFDVSQTPGVRADAGRETSAEASMQLRPNAFPLGSLSFFATAVRCHIRSFDREA